MNNSQFEFGKYASGFKNYCQSYSIHTMSFTNGYYDQFNLIQYTDIFEVPKKRCAKLMQQWSKLAAETVRIRLKYDTNYAATRKHSSYYRAHDIADERYGTPALDTCDDDDGDDWVSAIIIQRRRLVYLVEREQSEANFCRVREEEKKKRYIHNESEQANVRESKRRSDVHEAQEAAKWVITCQEVEQDRKKYMKTHRR